jgi:hypothetical protein
MAFTWSTESRGLEPDTPGGFFFARPVRGFSTKVDK